VRTKAQSSVAAEYRTKASFLATFPSFIEWPESAFSSAEAPFVVCVRVIIALGPHWPNLRAPRRPMAAASTFDAPAKMRN
jgi:hypothetical protein